jgi:hypothetical protein
MYPTLNRWMSAPTPVTTSIITTDSRSTWNAASITRSPAIIHVKYRCTNGAWASPAPNIARKIATARANDANNTPGPTKLTTAAKRWRVGGW